MAEQDTVLLKQRETERGEESHRMILHCLLPFLIYPADGALRACYNALDLKKGKTIL